MGFSVTRKSGFWNHPNGIRTVGIFETNTCQLACQPASQRPHAPRALSGRGGRQSVRLTGSSGGAPGRKSTRTGGGSSSANAARGGEKGSVHSLLHSRTSPRLPARPDRFPKHPPPPTTLPAGFAAPEPRRTPTGHTRTTAALPIPIAPSAPALARARSAADASRAEPHTHESQRRMELARRPEPPRLPEPMVDAGSMADAGPMADAGLPRGQCRTSPYLGPPTGLVSKLGGRC